MSNLVTRATRAPLALINRLGNAELTERLGLRQPWLRAVHSSAKAVVTAAREAPFRLPRAASATKGDGFDLTLTDEQTLMRDTARKLALDVLRPAALAADTACATPANIFARGHDLALAALSIPEQLGGLAESRSPVTTCLIAEELARGDVGLACALLAPIAVVNAIADWGTAAQQERWLPRFTGETFVPAALALLEPRAGFDPIDLRTGAVRCASGWRLFGEKVLVPLAQDAELLLVAAMVLGVGPRLFVVERGTSGVMIEAQPAMGLRAAATSRVVLRDVVVPDHAMLGGPASDYNHEALVDGARLAWAAFAVGAAQAVLDYVIPYCNERVAFGEPITNRQAVAFAIANIAIETDAMRLLTWRAAALAERGVPFGREAALARRFCAKRGMQIGSDGVQLLGGHGFVKEHPVERWYRDLRAVGIMEGALLA
ncbi:MAG TPA: acyl-CoA dehydrogenase family protein [Kofleriaceae bacterium]|nr:acyl-CoA dehydrogenase family protein [Kofleriaceae bacterium]